MSLVPLTHTHKYVTASIPSFMGAPHGWVCHKLVNLDPTNALPTKAFPSTDSIGRANLLSKNEDK